MPKSDTKADCIVTIYDFSDKFIVSKPDAKYMSVTQAEIERVLYHDCYCPGATLVYKGLLRWTIILDGVEVGSVHIPIPKKET